MACPLACLALLSTFKSGNYSITSSSLAVGHAFQGYRLVPDLLPASPPNLVTVIYTSRTYVMLGNVLGLDQVQYPPLTVEYYACPERFYTLILLNADNPNRMVASRQQYLLWQVGNIPADDVFAGESLADFQPAQPPAPGTNRYVYLIYRQQKKLTFTEQRLDSSSATIPARRFSLARFVAKYGLTLVAGNFFQSATDNTACLQGLVPRKL